jgi:membrane associated rhomboid family serine protease
VKVRPPVVTSALVGGNLVAYTAERAAMNAGGNPCETWGLVPARFLRGDGLVQVFSATFLHASWMHLAGNVAVLIVLGTIAERALGHLQFLAVFLGAGFVAGVTHMAVAPASTTAMVGASGPIFSLLPMVAVVRPITLAFIVPYVALNLLALVLPHSVFAMPGVAVSAHIGGFVFGSLVVLVGRARGTVEAWQVGVV